MYQKYLNTVNNQLWKMYNFTSISDTIKLIFDYTDGLYFFKSFKLGNTGCKCLFGKRIICDV